MKVFFDSQVSTYFTAYKLTLVPGENIIHDEAVARELLAAHADDCKRSAHIVPASGHPGKFETVKDKPRLRRIEENLAQKKPAKVITSATKPDPKKGAK